MGHFPPLLAAQRIYIIPGTIKKMSSIIAISQLTPFVGVINCLQFPQYFIFVIFSFTPFLKNLLALHSS